MINEVNRAAIEFDLAATIDICMMATQQPTSSRIETEVRPVGWRLRRGRRRQSVQYKLANLERRSSRAASIT